MDNDDVWVLGASDPEMAVIEALLVEQGRRLVYATINGARVTPETAYEADSETPSLSSKMHSAGFSSINHLYLVECDFASGRVSWPAVESTVRVDHHRPGDPGYGVAPCDFLAASTLGQVLAVLNLKPTKEQLFCAAADHCLGAAYQGQCPGVDPDSLMRWRVQNRAEHQFRNVFDVLRDVHNAMTIIRQATYLQAHTVYGGPPVPVAHDYILQLNIIDLRGGFCSKCQTVGNFHADTSLCIARTKHSFRPVPELPEAGARLSQAYVAVVPVPDGLGTLKVVMGAAIPKQVGWFLGEYPALKKYGDSARGFAGGFLPGRWTSGVPIPGGRALYYDASIKTELGPKKDKRWGHV